VVRKRQVWAVQGEFNVFPVFVAQGKWNVFFPWPEWETGGDEYEVGGDQVTAESPSWTIPYVSVVGYSWHPVHAWCRAFPGEPFLGVRVDTEEVWVVFGPKTVAGPILRPVFEQGCTGVRGHGESVD
jgi:hypothetical protein